MSKNYMADIAKMLGVELGEEFNVVDKDGKPSVFNPFHIAEGGLIDCNGDDDSGYLESLLTGALEIIKKPWKPKDGEIYYYIDADRGKAYNAVWNDHPKIVGNYLIGNVFRTEEEAEANIEAYREYIENKEPDLSWRVK